MVTPVPLRRRPWKPGDLRTAPWLGLTALLAGLGCALSTVWVLTSSDGKSTASWPVKEWPMSPAVVLAILTATANVLLVLAFQEGWTIAWWVKMRQGGSIVDYHRYWAYGSGAFRSITSGRSFNRIALACVAMSLIVVDGPLLQRASTTVGQLTTKPVTFSAALSPDPFPRNFSGYYMTHAFQINMLTPDFAKVDQMYNSRSAIALQYRDCDGTCRGTLVGPGFDINCTSDLLPYNLSDVLWQEYWVGSVDVYSDGPFYPGEIDVQTVYKPSRGAAGHLRWTNCGLHTAIVRTPS